MVVITIHRNMNTSTHVQMFLIFIILLFLQKLKILKFMTDICNSCKFWPKSNTLYYFVIKFEHFVLKDTVTNTPNE